MFEANYTFILRKCQNLSLTDWRCSLGISSSCCSWFPATTAVWFSFPSSVSDIQCVTDSGPGRNVLSCPFLHPETTSSVRDHSSGMVFKKVFNKKIIKISGTMKSCIRPNISIQFRSALFFSILVRGNLRTVKSVCRWSSCRLALC